MAAKLCNVCNIRRPKTGSKGTETSPHNDMCNYCHEEGGQENTHNDYNHAGIAKQVAAGVQLTKDQESELALMNTCWICHPELNLAQQPAKAASTGPKAQGARRPQLNHKGHSHPATPAARRACKALFWAHYGTPTVAEFSEWDAKLDGFGKPVTGGNKVPNSPGSPAEAYEKKTKFTVVPRGPKGGVINQLKASKPKK